MRSWIQSIPYDDYASLTRSRTSAVAFYDKLDDIVIVHKTDKFLLFGVIYRSRQDTVAGGYTGHRNKS